MRHVSVLINVALKKISCIAGKFRAAKMLENYMLRLPHICDF